uniref:Uncharacterized protein n=1 Tax=Biomphalaria glabrata TaxID=6526 RepID=A0A2C9L0T7_BIOGL
MDPDKTISMDPDKTISMDPDKNELPTSSYTVHYPEQQHARQEAFSPHHPNISTVDGVYLRQAVGRVLPDCLQDVVQVRPADPIQYLAKRLYHSVDCDLHYYDKKIELTQMEITRLEQCQLKASQSKQLHKLKEEIEKLKRELEELNRDKNKLLASSEETSNSAL